jgi:hypothetical protein
MLLIIPTEDNDMKIMVHFSLHGLLGSLTEVLETEDMDDKVIRKTINQELLREYEQGNVGEQFRVKEIFFIEQVS